MLKDDYYTGLVTRRGVKVKGRHEPLIDQETFERVQRILAAHKAGGDRSQKHKHHLSGSVHCGVCKRRLGYGRHRGNGGVYEYFSCLSRVSKTGRCQAPYFRVPAVERAIERKYKTLLLTPVEQQAIRHALLKRVGVKTEAARREADRHERRLRELLDQQQKLVHLHYAGKVDDDVLAVEQDRIKRERAQAEQWTQAAKQEAQDVEQTLSDALLLIDASTVPYLTAAPFERRLINLAIYLMLLIHSIEQIEAKITALYAQLVPLARRLAHEQAAQGRQKPPRQAKSPGNQPENDHDPGLRGRGSHFKLMAGLTGGSSKMSPAWQRIRALHAQRFGLTPKQPS